MKKIHTSLATITFALVTSASSLQAATGELVANPHFMGNDYTGWNLNSPWRHDGDSGRLVFDVNNSNVRGFFSAVGDGVDLTTDPTITGDPAFTDTDNAILTAVTFNNPFVQTFSGPPTDGTYKLFIELDIVTARGTYQAKSQEFTNPWATVGEIIPTLTWQGGGFLGDPSDATEGGIAISSISDINYKLVMFIEASTTDGTTSFFTADNLFATYDVSFIPEPSSYTMIAGFLGLGYIMAARRRSAAN